MKSKFVQCNVGAWVPEDEAKKIDEITSSLPHDCTYQTKAVPVDYQFEPNERAEVSIITTSNVDKDNEVVIAAGVDLDTYRNSMIVLWEHDKSKPIASCGWIKLHKDTIRAKTIYPEKPEDVDTPWFTNQVWAMTKCSPPILRCKSIGFIPKTPKRQPTMQELQLHPQWKDAGILDSVMMLEYSCVHNGCLNDAVVEQINMKSLDAAILKEMGIEPVIKSEPGLFHPNCRCSINDDGSITTAGDDAVCEQCQGEAAKHMVAMAQKAKVPMSLKDAMDYVYNIKKNKPDYSAALAKAIDNLNFNANAIIEAAKESYKNRGRV